MNTLEGNKLIAEFMGYKPVRCSNGFAWDIGKSIPSKDHLFPIQGKLITKYCNYLKFHTSWDWLMPVVEKIESLNLGTIKLDEDDMFRNANAVFRIEYKDVYIDLYGGMKKQDEWMEQTQFHSKLDATYKAVLEFIQWYNENK